MRLEIIYSPIFLLAKRTGTGQERRHSNAAAEIMIQPGRSMIVTRQPSPSAKSASRMAGAAQLHVESMQMVGAAQPHNKVRADGGRSSAAHGVHASLTSIL